MTTTTSATAVTGAVGTAHTRVEGRDKVTGAARYAGEIPFDELAHGWLVLSTVARGRIRSVETAAVLGMPGVSPSCTTGTPRAVDTDYVGMLGSPGPDRRRLPARPGAAHGLAGGAGRRRDVRAGQGGRRGARGALRRGAARHRVLRRTPGRIPARTASCLP